jgi:hypothetical protein
MEPLLFQRPDNFLGVAFSYPVVNKVWGQASCTQEAAGCFTNTAMPAPYEHFPSLLLRALTIGHSITIAAVISCNQDIQHLSVKKSSIKTIATSNKGNILPSRMLSANTIQTLDEEVLVGGKGYRIIQYT